MKLAKLAKPVPALTVKPLACTEELSNCELKLTVALFVLIVVSPANVTLPP